MKHVFPGANTPRGFFSLFDQIAAPDANKIFVVKGGPGVGKSTFMRKIAEDVLAQGYDVEYHHCSADNNSLDGIYIPAADIAMLDGTAPHVVDPKNPGAVDEIIHLGDFWDEAGMRAPDNRAAILRLNRECGFWFKRAYESLHAAQAYFEEWKAYYTAALDTDRLSARTEEVLEDLLPERMGKRGTIRRLFASAITYDGASNWLASLFDGAARRYVITGEPGTGKSTLVGRIAETALSRGYSLDAYHCPLYPDQIDHLLIRETGTAVITSTWPHEYTPREGDVVVDTSEFVKVALLAPFAEEIEGARTRFHDAIRREIHHLSTAKRVHDEMEQYYIPHMNFAAIEELRVKTRSRVLALIEERSSNTPD